MKLFVAAVFATLALSMAIPIEENTDWVDIDWSKVVPIEEIPGFWEGRDIRPAFYEYDEQRRGERIAGGDVVTPGAHPYQAGLLITTLSGDSGLCGGSIISTRTILTAAHCLSNTIQTVAVLGAHQLQASEATQQRIIAPSDTYRIHGNFNPLNLNNDIATIQLPYAVQVTPRRSAIILAPASTLTFAGVTAEVSGWGRIEDGGDFSPYLRSVQNAIITNAVCTQSFNTYAVIESTICMSSAVGRAACTGDTGGPLTTIVGGNRQQIGVISFGSSAGCTAAPSAHARVTSFRLWINENTI